MLTYISKLVNYFTNLFLHKRCETRCAYLYPTLLIRIVAIIFNTIKLLLSPLIPDKTFIRQKVSGQQVAPDKVT